MNKPIRLPLLTMIIRCVFNEDGKIYPQRFLDDTLQELVKTCYSTKKIDASEGIDVNKTSVSKECELWHYQFFKDMGFKFEEHVCKGCHDLLTKAQSLENVAILSVKGATFRCILQGISRNEDLRRLSSSALENKDVL